MIPRGDTARTLVISLKNRGIAYAPDENCRAVFTALKPDGTVVFNEASVSGNEIIYPLSAQTTAVEGALRCQLRLYGYDERLLISPGFSLEISEAVCADEPIVESRDEVSALTALVTDTNELIDTVRQSLADGDFVPQISIGSVSTLPSGSMASVEIGGTKQAPVLNFAIPQGPEGQAQNLIPDSALSADSTRPVQNAVITAALSEKLDKSEFELSSKNFVKTEEFSEAVSNFVELEEIGNYLETKVDKVSGKGLSSNDFTDAEKSKLAAIEAGANKYTLPALGVGTSHLANSAVTRAKLANDTLYSPWAYMSQNASTVLSLEHLGKTLNMSSGTADFTLSVTRNAIPAGGEVAVLNLWSKSNRIVFDSNVKAAVVGQSSYLTGASLTIPDAFGMIALKKIAADSSYDYWLVTGNVEVLS